MNFPLEESTTEKIPTNLNNVIKQLHSDGNDLMQNDIFIVLILFLMLENGFVTTNNVTDYIDHAKHITKIIQSQRKTGFYKETFLLCGLDDMTVDIIMSPIGSAIIVNTAINNDNQEMYSVCLPTSRYVVAPKASTIPMIFRDLKHLSTAFKNQIVSPVKCTILSYCGYPSASLVGLPDDIFFSLIMLLSIEDILNVSKTCRRLKVILDDETLWHALYKRDFQVVVQNDRTDWKMVYKETYLAELEKKNLPQLTGTIHDYMDISDMISYIDNPLWNIL
ncbi:F-box only protein 7-like [Pieris brassicae]|uniref:F-box only protein 7-like n=1 Tax=Pieris brassicae TaxID=7116 RepID=UPI001E6600D7|nr:F-box only protein 7-like [Pieris brassicae]